MADDEDEDTSPESNKLVPEDVSDETLTILLDHIKGEIIALLEVSTDHTDRLRHILQDIKNIRQFHKSSMAPSRRSSIVDTE